MVGEGENGGIVTLWDENRQNKAENKKKRRWSGEGSNKHTNTSNKKKE